MSVPDTTQEQAGVDAYTQWKANVSNERSSAYGGNLHDLARRIYIAMTNAAPQEISAEASRQADVESSKAKKPGAPASTPCRTGEAETPCEAAPNAIVVTEELRSPDISAFETERYGWFKPDGSFEELDMNLSLVDPRRDRARWVGGEHDMQLLRALLSAARKNAVPQASANLLDDRREGGPDTGVAREDVKPGNAGACGAAPTTLPSPQATYSEPK